MILLLIGVLLLGEIVTSDWGLGKSDGETSCLHVSPFLLWEHTEAGYVGCESWGNADAV